MEKNNFTKNFLTKINMKKFYVTYYWAKMNGGRSETKAIECPNEETMLDCGRDIYSLHGIRRVSFNRCGRLPKKTTIIPYEKYVSGDYYHM